MAEKEIPTPVTLPFNKYTHKKNEFLTATHGREHFCEDPEIQ